jgi:hypothetical protein
VGAQNLDRFCGRWSATSARRVTVRPRLHWAMTPFGEYAFDSSEALVVSMLGRQLVADQEHGLVTAARRWLSENECPRQPHARGRGRYLVPADLARRFPTECWPWIKHLAHGGRSELDKTAVLDDAARSHPGLSPAARSRSPVIRRSTVASVGATTGERPRARWRRSRVSRVFPWTLRRNQARLEDGSFAR